MTPLQRYEHDLLQGGFSADSAQRQAVQALDALFHELVQLERRRETASTLRKLARRWRQQPVQPVTGLYLWGGVGRGKTWLVDTFFDCLPFQRKMRLHFHRFMQRVHSELTRLEGTPDPLLSVADTLVAEARIVCLDEFSVSDITDAMILGSLMEALFERGITLVATSNTVPDQLYRNGLQRQRFLPAIALVRQHTRVLSVGAGVDYRLRALERAELYHWPLDEAADESLKRSFDSLAPEVGTPRQRLQVNGRYLSSRCVADDVVWFDFSELCDGPRSQNDYIELARIYHAVLLGNVPQMGRDTDDQARRFVNLVDEFYDRNVKLVLSAEVPLLNLYKGGGLDFVFERTLSRLREMQSHEYLARSHKP